MNYDVFISYNSSDKLIADAVCHHMEARQIRCFIAPRDISASDWAGCITAAIERARAFVVIVSENSIPSNEVAKEITLATRVSNYIFPFRIDRSELDGRMTYHLSAFHWIDAVDPPLEKRIKDLVDRVEAVLCAETSEVKGKITTGSLNVYRQRLLNQSVRPRSEFVGRTRELAEIDTLYQQGANAVFLCGMGGIGKSEIAKAYAKNNNDKYTTVVFATYETDLMHLITDDQDIAVENLSQASAAGGQGETTEAYYARKMKVLRSIVNEHTLIIIDNFDVEEDPQLEEVLQLPCHLLITTRIDFASYGYNTVKIGPMEELDDLVWLFTKLDRSYPSTEEQQAVCDIIQLLERHTYAVSLTAAQMKAGRIKPTKMLAQLREEGLHIHTRSGFAREAGAKKATAYEYIQALFDFSLLDEMACHILRCLSCMPRDGIDIDLFMECAEVEEYGDIGHLVDLNWVQLDDENGKISLHMLVRELVKERLTPTIANCEPLLRHAYAHADNAWNKIYEENDIHNGLIFSLLEAFPQPTIEVLDWFEEYATFAWIQGRFDLAETCEHKLYALCVEHYGEISVQAGNQALRVAAVYHNMGDYVSARPWYEKGLRIQEGIDPESADAFSARAKVARSNAQNGDYESAFRMFARNLEIQRKLFARACEEVTDQEQLRKAHVQMAFARLNMAHINCCLGQYEEALPLAQLAEEYLLSDTVEPALIIYVMLVMVYVYHGIKDYEKALGYAQSALEKTQYYRNDMCIESMCYHEIKGDLFSEQERFDEAYQSYSMALGGREKMYPADVNAIKRLEQKCENARVGRDEDMPFLDIWT